MTIPNPLDDLNPDRLHPPTEWLRTQTTYDDDAGVYYEPFVKDGRVGYRVASNRPGIGQETYIYLNPSDGSDDGVPTVFVYQGIENDPSVDQPDDHHVIEGVGYQPGEQPAEGAEQMHAQWAQSRTGPRHLPYAHTDGCHGCGRLDPCGEHYADCVLLEPGDTLIDRATERSIGVYDGPDMMEARYGP